MDRMIPDGKCMCGCGGDAQLGKFFLVGHNISAVRMLIELDYETDANFLREHGYGIGGKNLTEAHKAKGANNDT